jgi:hypothetical protein
VPKYGVYYLRRSRPLGFAEPSKINTRTLSTAITNIMFAKLAKVCFILLVLAISSIHGAHILGDEDTPPKVAATTGFVPNETQLLDDLERDFEIQRAADANKVSSQYHFQTAAHNLSLPTPLSLIRLRCFCSCTRSCGVV